MNEYSPRPGTKGALAIAALLDGPMSMQQMATAIGVSHGDVSAHLKSAIENAAIVRLKDETGLLHLALAGMPVDERFHVHGGGPGKSDHCLGKALPTAQLVRKVTKRPDVSAEAIAAANPFGLHRPANISRPAATTHHNQNKIAIKADPVPQFTQVTTATPPQPSHQQSDFSAGVFTTGEIVITLGQQHIKLNSTHAHELRAFLNIVQEQA